MEPITDLKERLTTAATQVVENASGVSEDVQARAKDAWDTVQHQTSRAMHEGSAYVHKNPVPTALAAFGLGFMIGVLFSRRSPDSFKDRYLAEPLHQSRGVLLGLLLACTALLRRTFSSASVAAENIVDNLGDELHDSLKPLKKAAQQTGRKLGL